MSFWEDASPLLKGAIVVGVLGIIAAIGLWFVPTDGEEAAAQQRGVDPSNVVTAEK